MRITNNGQFTNLFNRKNVSFSMNESDTIDNKPKADYTVKSKPLQSRSFVVVKNRQKSRPVKDTGDYRVTHFGNTWIEKSDGYSKPESIKSLENTIRYLKSKRNKVYSTYEYTTLSKTISDLENKLQVMTTGKSETVLEQERLMRSLIRQHNAEKLKASKQSDLPKSNKAYSYFGIRDGVWTCQEKIILK